MARVRGRDLRDAMAFVREGHGAEAAERVLQAVDPDVRGALADLRDVEWYDLGLLQRFLVTAGTLLAGNDEDFYRRQGFFAGQRQKAAFIGPMVSEPEVRMKMAPTVWRMFYDVGRLVVTGQTAREATGQIWDFPATRELCARFRGIWEGIISEGVRRVAEERRCVRRGDPCCELYVHPPPAGGGPGDPRPEGA
jgi:hypothetical protein